MKGTEARELCSPIIPFVFVDKVFVVGVFVFQFVFVQILFHLVIVDFLGVYVGLILLMIYFLLFVLFIRFFFFFLILVVVLISQVVFFIICKVLGGILFIPVRECVVVLSLLAGKEWDDPRSRFLVQLAIFSNIAILPPI